MDWETWVKVGGLAPVPLDFTTAKLNESIAMASAYIAGAGETHPDNYMDYVDWYSSLHVIFMEQLLTQYDETTLAIMDKIDTDFNVTDTVDPEVRQRWYPLGIKKNYTKVMEPAKTFVQGMGRWKYVKPIYLALKESD